MTNFNLQSLNNAIYQTAGNFSLGIGKLGTKIGINAVTFNNKCNPNSDHKLTLSETINLLRETQNPNILMHLMPHSSVLWVRKIKLNHITSEVGIINAWADWEFEHAESLKTISQSLKDHVISAKELDSIRKELNEAFSQEVYLLQLIERHIIGSSGCSFLSSLNNPTKLSFDGCISSLIQSCKGNIEELVSTLNTTKGSLLNKIDSNNSKAELNIHEVFIMSSYSNNSALVDFIAEQSGFFSIQIERPSSELKYNALLDIWVDASAERAETIQYIKQLLEQDEPQSSLINTVCENMFQEFCRGYALLDRLKYMKQQHHKPRLTQ